MYKVKIEGAAGYYNIYQDGNLIGYIDGGKEVYVGLYTGGTYENGAKKRQPVMRIKYGPKKITRAKKWVKAVLANMEPMRVIIELDARDKHGYPVTSPYHLGLGFGVDV